MLKKTCNCALLALAAGGGSAWAQPAQLPTIPEGRTIVPYVYGGITYDDNVFRVSGAQEARQVTGGPSKDDTVGHYGAGFLLNKPISLQTIRLQAAVEQVDYFDFDDLDHTAGYGLAAWDWEIGRLFNGTLSHHYDRSISNFTQFQQAVRDPRDLNVSHLDGGYQFLPDWRMELGGELRDIDYDRQNFLDRKEAMGYGELQYATTLNSHVGLRVQNTEADLEPTDDNNGARINNDFSEQEYSAVLGWEGSGKSYLEGRAGVTHRDQDDPTQKDFTGFTGQLLHRWEITPITTLETSIFRRVNALDFQIASFVVTDGVALAPRIQITPDTGLSGRFAYEHDNFEGPVRDQNGNTISDANREDDVSSARLAVDYQAILDLTLLLGVEYRNRASNQNSNDFDDTRLISEISYAF